MTTEPSAAERREALERRAIAIVSEERGPEWAVPKIIRAMMRFRDEALTPASPSTADGAGDWRWVPVEPTSEMLEASAIAWTGQCNGYPPEAGHYKFMRGLWSAMLTTAPKPASEDTVAFVQEWMMSGDHGPTKWDREFAAAIDARVAANPKPASEDVRPDSWAASNDDVRSRALLLAEVELHLQSCRIFLTSREKMHPCGVDLHDELQAKITAALDAVGREKARG